MTYAQNPCKTKLLGSKINLTHLSEKLSTINDEINDWLDPSKTELEVLESKERILFWI